MIKNSPLFDAPWYSSNCSDLFSRICPAAHYLLWGVSEDNNPSPHFSNCRYLRENPDVFAAHMNPLVHYILYGKEEGRTFPRAEELSSVSRADKGRAPGDHLRNPSSSRSAPGRRLWEPPPPCEELHRIKTGNFYRYCCSKLAGRVEVLNTPLEIYLETSNACNLDCIFCIPDRRAPKGTGKSAILSPEMMRAAQPYLMGVAAIALHGYGEPLLNRYTVPAAAEGSDYMAYTQFFTNGLLLHPRRAEALVRARVKSITVSISTPDPVEYQRLYRNSKFTRLVDNLRFLRAEKERQATEYPRIGINAIAMRDTLPRLPDLVRLAGELGVESIELKPLVVYANLPRVHDQRLVFDEKRDEPILEEARRLAADLGIHVNLAIFEAAGSDDPKVHRHGEVCRTPREHLKSGACPLVFRSMYIRSNGMVKPCCFALDDPELSMGELRSQSIQAIWNGAQYHALRRTHLLGEAAPVCARCFEFNLRPPADATQDWLTISGIPVYDPSDLFKELGRTQSKVQTFLASEGTCPSGLGAEETSVSRRSVIAPFAADLARFAEQAAVESGGGSRFLRALGDVAESLVHESGKLRAMLDEMESPGNRSPEYVPSQLLSAIKTWPDKLGQWKEAVLRALGSDGHGRHSA
ncbi:MAG: radical SAM protein [Deltaproteobacteria bacterium]|nr:radical SAM protein [Deltaproteobacteria bacterium]